MLSLALMLATNEVTSKDKARAIVNAIIAEAQAIWGEDWFPNLVRRYCEIEQAEGVEPEKATPINRRTQILFLTKPQGSDPKQNPKIETLLKLAEAVGGEVQLVFTRKEVKRF
ncbi:MAG: hypothetical protein HC878_03590 [Leptolyngbyaceae cyanobacterium SL_5_14]|nr:hypothetical protein [Leptolyngbyaceae cyanobacterium SL_5_14]